METGSELNMRGRKGGKKGTCEGTDKGTLVDWPLVRLGNVGNSPRNGM